MDSPKDQSQMPIKEYLTAHYPEEIERMRQQQAAFDAALAGYRALNEDTAQLTGLAAETAKATDSPAAEIVSRNLEADAERAMKETEPAQDVQEYTVEKENAQEVQEGKEEPRRNVIDTDIDPRLNPNSPEFDIAAYSKAIADAGGMEAMTDRLKNDFEAIQKQMQKTMFEAIKGTTPEMAEMAQESIAENAEALKDTAAMTQENMTKNAEALRDTAAAIVVTAKVALKGIAEFVNSDAYKAIKENLATITEAIAQHSAEIAALSDLAEEIQGLAAFLAIELEEAAQDPAFADYTLNDLLEQGFDADGNLTDSPFRQIIERAKQRQADFAAAENTIETVEQAAAELPRLIAIQTDKLDFPLDKANSQIWNLVESAAPNGQVKLNLNTSRKGSKQDSIVLYGINFDELESDLMIKKQLSPFDKRIYYTAAALFNGGNTFITATQIYKLMGNTGDPSAKDLQKINDSITKMGAAHLFLDNKQETQANTNYKSFRYDASLLPFERVSAYINGQLTDSAIHLFREPPLMTFARERNQITRLSRQLLESPISKTDANLRLEDYLLERIGHMKSPRSKAPRKMLFSTIYDKCGITTKKQKQRAPEKIRRYLDHYKQCGWIAGYTETADGITIAV